MILTSFVKNKSDYNRRPVKNIKYASNLNVIQCYEFFIWDTGCGYIIQQKPNGSKKYALILYMQSAIY